MGRAGNAHCDSTHVVALGVITVAAGFYYYLRVITARYWQEPTDDTPITIGPLCKTVITGLTAAIIISATGCRQTRPWSRRSRSERPW